MQISKEGGVSFINNVCKMCFRFVLFAVLILALATSSSCHKLQNRDDEDTSSTTAKLATIPGKILVVEFPPRTFILGVLSVVALNIRGEPSFRLSSVVSQELLNWEIDAITAYFIILDEYSVVEVTERLEWAANKTDLRVEDLQILINASSCNQSSSTLTVNQVVSVILRLEGLYRESANITLNLGCGPQGNNGISTVTDDVTESTVLDVSDSTAASERRHHGVARHGVVQHADKHARQKGVNSRDHGAKQLHHLNARNHLKERNPHFQHDVPHNRHKERNAHQTN